MLLRPTSLSLALAATRPILSFSKYAKYMATLAKSSKKTKAGALTETSAWAAVVGIEIHAQIAAHSKIFSNSPLEFAAAPNSKVSFWDAALPGTLPVLNKRCVEAALATALALNARVNLHSEFDRKHYFYFDLPAGYQITQQRRPIAEHGHLDVGFGPQQQRVSITRLHLEHDSGKSIHTAPQRTLIDLNRAGAGLMEIVTAPDMHSGGEAAAFVEALVLILRTLGTCDGRMEEGSLRVDANVSVSRRDGSVRGPRCEIKNISGLRFLSRAIDYEINRQVALFEQGKPVISQTLTYDAEKNETRPLRSKESAVDYRFMPEPDLPPLRLAQHQIDAVLSSQPELPRAKVLRLVEQHGIALDDSATLVAEPGAVQYFENCLMLLSAAAPTTQLCSSTSSPTHMSITALSESITPSSRSHAAAAAAWIVSELFSVLLFLQSIVHFLSLLSRLFSEKNLSIEESPIDATRLAALLALVATGEISNRAAKSVFAAMVSDSRAPAILVDEKGLRQISDPETISRLCAEVLVEHASKVDLYRKGKTGLHGFLVAQVVAKTGGRASPHVASSLMTKALTSSS
eukprot:m.200850 g.200850  ORF g.200850 m.200850 type:complete len:574 (-) comp15500_c1_seq9:243-1964(-)